MLKNMRLRTKLIISFSAILIIPSMIISAVAFQNIKSLVIEQQGGYAHSSSDILNANITNTLQSKIDDIDYLANRISKLPLKMDKKSEVRTVLSEYAEGHNDVQVAYVGSAKGDMIQMPYYIYPKDYNPIERPWYKGALNEQDYSISDPYISALDNKLVITISKKLPNDMGVVGIDMSINSFQKLANEVKIGKKGFISIIDQHGNYITHPTKELGKPVDDEMKSIISSNKKTDTKDINNKTLSLKTNDLSDWKIVSTTYISEATTQASKTWLNIMYILVGSLILGGILNFFIIRSIISPIKKLRDSALTISEGDLTTEITVSGKDEVGQLAEAFEKMKIHLTALISNLKDNANTIRESSDLLSASTSENMASSQQITAAMQQVTINNERQTNQMAQSNQALGEVSDGIQDMASDTSQVTELSQTANQQALEGGQSIQETVEKMESIQSAVNETDLKVRSLYDRTKEINSILEIIRSIADQTNLLALNASIEAARAGEHGKGFAVVAEEVRKLAESSQQSAGQIETLIQTVQDDTGETVKIMESALHHVQDGTKVVENTAEKFDVIVKNMQSITPRMENVSAVSQEIAATISTMTSSSQVLIDAATENAAALEEVSASTEESLSSMVSMERTAQELQHLAEELQQSIQKFKLPN